MGKENLHPIPPRDPVSGGEFYISELANDDSGVTLRGRFEIPRYARLDPEQAKFLEIFLKCRGMLNSVEREMNLSYPTVRARLDSLLDALDLNSPREENGKRERSTDRKGKVLDELERGEITPEEAKERLGVSH